MVARSVKNETEGVTSGYSVSLSETRSSSVTGPQNKRTDDGSTECQERDRRR
ncbi:hypothetical protein RRG08_056162, partial [Elysia crispata]